MTCICTLLSDLPTYALSPHHSSNMYIQFGLNLCVNPTPVQPWYVSHVSVWFAIPNSYAYTVPLPDLELQVHAYVFHVLGWFAILTHHYIHACYSLFSDSFVFLCLCPHWLLWLDTHTVVMLVHIPINWIAWTLTYLYYAKVRCLSVSYSRNQHMSMSMVINPIKLHVQHPPHFAYLYLRLLYIPYPYKLYPYPLLVLSSYLLVSYWEFLNRFNKLMWVFWMIKILE